MVSGLSFTSVSYVLLLTKQWRLVLCNNIYNVEERLLQEHLKLLLKLIDSEESGVQINNISIFENNTYKSYTKLYLHKYLNI